MEYDVKLDDKTIRLYVDSMVHHIKLLALDLANSGNTPTRLRDSLPTFISINDELLRMDKILDSKEGVKDNG